MSNCGASRWGVRHRHPARPRSPSTQYPVLGTRYPAHSVPGTRTQKRKSTRKRTRPGFAASSEPVFRAFCGSPGRLPPVPPFFVLENMAWTTSLRSERRRSPPERCRDPFTAPLFAPEDLLCLSPEDDRRPPAKEDPLCLSLRGRELFSRRLGEPRASASLPSMGENKRGLPLHRREPVSGS